MSATGIDVVESPACGLRIMMEVFTWTSTVLPKKVTLEYQECSFSVEFSTSLREKHWQIVTLEFYSSISPPSASIAHSIRVRKPLTASLGQMVFIDVFHCSGRYFHQRGGFNVMGMLINFNHAPPHTS
ncbi:hypothetical protein ACTXT7_014815 [Hymenolepis weldensis]